MCILFSQHPSHYKQNCYLLRLTLWLYKNTFCPFTYCPIDQTTVRFYFTVVSQRLSCCGLQYRPSPVHLPLPHPPPSTIQAWLY